MGGGGVRREAAEETRAPKQDCLLRCVSCGVVSFCLLARSHNRSVYVGGAF